jgi:hypothetical protein
LSSFHSLEGRLNRIGKQLGETDLEAKFMPLDEDVLSVRRSWKSSGAFPIQTAANWAERILSSYAALLDKPQGLGEPALDC